MARFVIASLCAGVLVTCSPGRELVSPSGDGSLLPAGYLPPGGCRPTLSSRLPIGKAWSYRCVAGPADAEGFAGTLRLSAFRQGWRECGTLRFVKNGIAMALELDLRSPGDPRSPDAPGRGPREVTLVVRQWVRSDQCA
jgi:hypothetical protein